MALKRRRSLFVRMDMIMHTTADIVMDMVDMDIIITGKTVMDMADTERVIHMITETGERRIRSS